MKKIIMILVALLFLPIVNAQQGHMKLLAVSESEEGEVGGIADLFLEMQPGSGRVFLETFPLTRVDTQISTRFAKEMACEFSDADCDNLDFFYTITSNSAIIAGPSAGASITVLTISLLDNIKLKDDVAITGTINSGGLIGPVGGVKAKIEAGKIEGLNKVLIQKGKPITEDNVTFDAENLSKDNGIDIIEVATLTEALEHFTGRKFKQDNKNVSIDPSYKDTMKVLAIDLCSRSTKLFNNFNKTDFKTNDTGINEDNALNLSKRGRDAFSEKKYYSSASYCFGANVEYNYLLLLTRNFTEAERLEKAKQIERDIKKFDRSVSSFNIKTITDLESYMVVKERLTEANDIINIVFENLNQTSTSLRNLAFARERLNSAKSWAAFMDNRGKEFNLNKDVLQEACRKKISEVEERLQYVQIYFPQNLENTRKELDYAYQDLNNGHYELCLFKASKAKANVDIILSVFGVEMEQVGNILNEKQKIVERNLVEETEKGIFPILGYSYYEYSNALKDDDPFSALLYSEYALELSNLDIYFKDGKKNIESKINFDNRIAIIFVIGVLMGVFLMKILESRKRHSGKVKRRKRKK
jgi:uncharacterized protein